MDVDGVLAGVAYDDRDPVLTLALSVELAEVSLHLGQTLDADVNLHVASAGSFFSSGAGLPVIWANSSTSCRLLAVLCSSARFVSLTSGTNSLRISRSKLRTS